MNRFRWTSSYGSGNDPLARGGSNPSYMAWHATGGPGNGPYISIFHKAVGPNVGSNGSEYKWCRPFSPLDAASTGRGAADPAYGNQIPLQTFTPTDQGDQTVSYGNRLRSGYYGKPEYQAAGVYFGNPLYPQVSKIFDGYDFYIQLRVKADPARMTLGSPVNGKLFFLTNTTNVTYCNQEIVTVSAYPKPNGTPNQPNRHTMYEGQFGYLHDIGTGPTENIGGAEWAYSGGWDTLLYHITPGTANVSGSEGVLGGGAGSLVRDTRVELWAAHEGETGYTKIWDTSYRAVYENQEQYTPGHLKYGWNAITLANYQNVDLGESIAASFYQNFAQVIFSKQFIPCPQV